MCTSDLVPSRTGAIYCMHRLQLALCGDGGGGTVAIAVVLQLIDCYICMLTLYTHKLDQMATATFSYKKSIR